MDATSENLKKLHKQALDLCYAIEELPASEKQTLLSLKSSATAMAIQAWWQEKDSESLEAEKHGATTRHREVNAQ